VARAGEQDFPDALAGLIVPPALHGRRVARRSKIPDALHSFFNLGKPFPGVARKQVVKFTFLKRGFKISVSPTDRDAVLDKAGRALCSAYYVSVRKE
jgi:hypothetical protein